MMTKNLKFPIAFAKLRGIPLNAHPGAFGCARKYNFHEGIDLYGSKGDHVYAIRSGVIVSNLPFTGASEGHPWWLETNAVTIQDNDGYYVYGEITSPLKSGTHIQSGDYVGEIIPVLTDDKFRPDIPGHSVSMLHLERWNNNYDESMGWRAWKTYKDRPNYLVDPTPELISILRASDQDINWLTFDPLVEDLSPFKDISDEVLFAEYEKRKKKKDAQELIENLKNFYHTCTSCLSRTHLSTWDKIRSYTFEDDVYTQNYLLNRDFEIICPACQSRNFTKEEYIYSNPGSETIAELELYKLCKEFERYGKFKNEYHYHNQYGMTPFYEIINEKGERRKIKDPYK